MFTPAASKFPETVSIFQDTIIACVQAEAAERGREAEELRQQLSSGAQHADALAAAQSQVHELEQQLGQVQAALQQESSTAQQALQVCHPLLCRHAPGLTCTEVLPCLVVYKEATGIWARPV